MAKGKQKNKNNKNKNKNNKKKGTNTNNSNSDVIPTTVPDIIITRSDEDDNNNNNNDSVCQQQQQQQQEQEQQQGRIETTDTKQNNNHKKSATIHTANAAAATTNDNNNANQDDNNNNNDDHVGDGMNNDDIFLVNRTNISNRSNDRSSENEINNDDGNNNNSSSNIRQGTISSARFNILCTMVGGGSLSVPLAFAQSGTLLVAPIILFVSAVITEFCFRIIIECTRKLKKQRQPQRGNNNHHNSSSEAVGTDTYESIAGAAFGPTGFVFAKTLVTLMCFAGTVGYAVLLRDMMQPVTDYFVSNNAPGPTLANNVTMWIIVVLITPVCTLKNLTSLKDLGAASMAAILVLVSCVTFRSIQCNFPHSIAGSSKFVHTPPYRAFNWETIYHYHLFPQITANHNATISAVLFAMLEQLLNVFPLYVSVYVCHYNLPPVQNELQSPSKARVGTWLRTTTWSATLFYVLIGISGSMYANCIPETELPLKGNILLSFDENDPLLFIGRMCLAITITLAFPLLTVPARDILLRTFFPLDTATTNTEAAAAAIDDVESSLRRPLLLLELELEEENNNNGGANNSYQRQRERERELQTTTAAAANNGNNSTHNEKDHSFAMRLAFAILVFWSSVAVASCVDGIDTVWDLLGSSLSILLCFLIPAGSYIIISKQQSSYLHQSEDERNNHENNHDGDDDDNDDDSNTCFGYSKDKLSMVASWALVWVYTPMMFISTVNAIYKTFFS